MTAKRCAGSPGLNWATIASLKTHSLGTSTARLHDSQVWNELLHVGKASV